MSKKTENSEANIYDLLLQASEKEKKEKRAELLKSMGVKEYFEEGSMEIDMRTCKGIECNLCVKTCPTFSIDEEGVKKGKPKITCAKCGKCVDTCPKEAVSFHIKGTPLSVNYEKARLMFIYPAFLFLAIMGSGMITGAIYRVLLLITTGSMIK